MTDSKSRWEVMTAEAWENLEIDLAPMEGPYLTIPLSVLQDLQPNQVIVLEVQEYTVALVPTVNGQAHPSITFRYKG